MGKAVALNWNEFMAGHIVPLDHKTKLSIARNTAATVHLFLFPKSIFAATPADSSWQEIFDTVLGIADWLCVGIIVFAGVTWMFGNRTKALEFLMGGASGYLIIRHAIDIRNWLKTL
ncbi:TrbC/VirB2 family protein [Cohnella yongneupensis]|uniref:TrbC/VirB2 family protein n=1 Tax=Cohnella yongneupensis TaxID=425006 RepID=A0ABW0QUJ6_9BACL